MAVRMATTWSHTSRQNLHNLLRLYYQIFQMFGVGYTHKNIVDVHALHHHEYATVWSVWTSQVAGQKCAHTFSMCNFKLLLLSFAASRLLSWRGWLGDPYSTAMAVSLACAADLVLDHWYGPWVWAYWLQASHDGLSPATLPAVLLRPRGLTSALLSGVGNKCCGSMPVDTTVTLFLAAAIAVSHTQSCPKHLWCPEFRLLLF